MAKHLVRQLHFNITSGGTDIEITCKPCHVIFTDEGFGVIGFTARNNDVSIDFNLDDVNSIYGVNNKWIWRIWEKED